MAKRGKGSRLHLLGEYHDKALFELTRESDRGIALVVSALLEDVLGRAIQSRVHHADDEKINRLFRPDGPFGAFSVRITVGFALGIFGPGVRADLDRIRSIRNDFAHHIVDLNGAHYSFEATPISDKCLALVSPERFLKMLDDQHASSNAAGGSKPSERIPSNWGGSIARQRFIMTGYYLSLLLENATKTASPKNTRPHAALNY